LTLIKGFQSFDFFDDMVPWGRNTQVLGNIFATSGNSILEFFLKH